MKETQVRLTDHPFALESELRDAANEHGYRIAQGQAAGWLFFSSASAPGEIAVAATKNGMSGPFFLSVAHPGAARELKAEQVQKVIQAPLPFQIGARSSKQSASCTACH